MFSLFPDTGAEKIKKPFYILVVVFVAVTFSYAISVAGIKIGAVLILLPAIVFVVIRIFLEPRWGLILSFAFSFFAIGLTRYVKGVPLGLVVDGMLLLSVLALILGVGRKIEWSKAKHDVTALSAVWMGFTILELANPQATSAQAWFYAMRGVAFYQILMIPLGFLLIRNVKDLKLFIWIWLIISTLAALKGMQQIMIGPDPWENAWLDGGGELTHRIQGRLRAFSFYSDAGQFGAAMGHASLVAGIIALGPGSLVKKIIFGAIAFITLLGMLYSGTRGALFVPAPGIMLFFFLSKNFKVFVLGVLAAVAVYGVLRFTYIGNNSYQIYRIRTAVQPSLDRSYQVRLENQRKLKVYMSNKPLGGGIGSAGNWGMRFSPNTFLAQTPTDSWYVRIWAEMGIIGLSLHLFILFWILIHCSWITWKLKDPELKQIINALTAGIFGIMVASYGNGLYGQMPTAMIIYMSYVFVYLAPGWDKELVKNHGKRKDLLLT
ncbi:MAG: O-antigen ligase family protein [Bacteroidales bacterium]|nr:O-antigen ligase family protein [Bacteroidales bacterium]